MRRLIALTVAASAVAMGGTGTSTAEAHVLKNKTLQQNYNHVTYVCKRGSGKPKRWHCQAERWIAKRLWGKIDTSIWPSINYASDVFNVSASTMRTIVGREGGNVHPAKLRVSLCQTYGIGWNVSGNPPSAAFGPYQFMLDYRGACFNPEAWGTFGAHDDAAFSAAWSRGARVPILYKHPASNLGQSLTTAYMLATPSTGGISHWCASMC